MTTEHETDSNASDVEERIRDQVHDRHAPLGAVSTGDAFATPAVSQTFYAPRVAGGERAVFSAADVAAVYDEGEIDADLAMNLTAGFAHGVLSAARLLAVLPQDTPPEHGKLVTVEQISTFVRRRFPGADVVKVDPQHHSLTLAVTVAIGVQGDECIDLVDRIYFAIAAHVPVGVQVEVHAVPTEAF